jgi:GTP-binding protein HflX
MIKIYKYAEVKRSEIFARENPTANVSDAVSEIISNVVKNGDKALFEYSKKFDKAELSALEVTPEEIDEAFAKVDKEFIDILKEALINITDFHSRQWRGSFIINEKDGVITVALVGYTNAGKSTLMNALTDAGVLAEDKLFATLDPTSRKLSLPNGQDVMLIDTVGFVSRLPHDLVKAFKSTLEEASEADVILNVCDASDIHCSEHIEITTDILRDLGCKGDNIITVMNKCDKAENIFDLISIGKTVMISALNGTNLDLLLKEIEKVLELKSVTLDLLIPFSKGGEVNFIRNNGKILSEEFTADGTVLKVILPAEYADKYKDYIM